MYTNTRKRVALVVLGLIVASSTLIAQQYYDFKVGQLYYKITDTVNRKVAVVPERFNIPYYSDKPTGAVAIPATVVNGSNTYSVTSIGESAFESCSGLTSIDIPNNVTSIGRYAFYSCSGLTSITIPNSVTSIGANASSDCSGLTSITIPSSVTSIGSSAFSYCSNLTSIAIPRSVTKIEGGTFSGCSKLTSIAIPNSITSIGDRTFSGCSRLASINIPNSVTSIGTEVFSSSGIISITIPNSVTSIGYGAFSYCYSLTSVNIPSSVTSIGESAFSSCVRLTSVNIPSSVTSIGGEAFSGCSGLTLVVVGWQTPLAISPDVFRWVTLDSVKLIVPSGKKNVYQTADVWKDFNPIVEVGPMNYIVTYSQSVGGTFKVKNGSQEIASVSIVDHGTVLTIEARAAEHYKLDSILVNGTRIAGLSFTVTENTNIEVFFGKQRYAVTYNNPSGGNIQVTKGTDIVVSGENVEEDTELIVRATPDSGFVLNSLTLNGQDIGNGYTFRIDKAVDIKAVFTATTTALDEAATEPLAIYPNPMAEVLYLSATARTIRIYDMYGTEVAHAADTDKVEVSLLPAGVYTVRADGKKAKVVKK